MSILNFFRRLMGIETAVTEDIPPVEKPAKVPTQPKVAAKPKKYNPNQGKKKPTQGKSL